jgi:alkyl hydroperoxide reductase subunit D
MCLAASAIGGCGVCLQAHEKVVREGGLSEDAVFDAVRLAAVVKGVAVGLALGA